MSRTEGNTSELSKSYPGTSRCTCPTPAEGANLEKRFKTRVQILGGGDSSLDCDFM